MRRVPPSLLFQKKASPRRRAREIETKHVCARLQSHVQNRYAGRPEKQLAYASIHSNRGKGPPQIPPTVHERRGQHTVKSLPAPTRRVSWARLPSPDQLNPSAEQPGFDPAAPQAAPRIATLLPQGEEQSNLLYATRRPSPTVSARCHRGMPLRGARRRWNFCVIIFFFVLPARPRGCFLFSF